MPSAPGSEYLGRALYHYPRLHTHTHTHILWSRLPYQNCPESAARLSLAHQGAATGPVSHTESLLITHSQTPFPVWAERSTELPVLKGEGGWGKRCAFPGRRNSLGGFPLLLCIYPPPALAALPGYDLSLLGKETGGREHGFPMSNWATRGSYLPTRHLGVHTYET